MRLLRRLKRRRRARSGHPTPQQAFDALSQGFCLYAPISTCSGNVRSVGLRDEDDVNEILVCRVHYGRLRKLRELELDALEHFLVPPFAKRRGARVEEYA